MDEDGRMPAANELKSLPPDWWDGMIDSKKYNRDLPSM